MRHTVRYHLRALVRPLKRRTGIKGTHPSSRAAAKAPMACVGSVPCHHAPHSRSVYSLLPADDMLLEESIELLPPARMVDPAIAPRPSTAPSSPGTSSSSSSSSSSSWNPTLAAGASTSTLDTFGPSTPTSEDLPSDLPDVAAKRRTRRRRRETWAKSLALDSLFYLPDEEEGKKAEEDVETKPRDALRTKRDSFMWMKFDGHGGGLAWADGARLAGAPMVM